jgi:hypothetical protein
MASLRALQSTAGGAMAVSTMAWLGERGASKATTHHISNRVLSSSVTKSSLLDNYRARFLKQQQLQQPLQQSVQRQTLTTTTKETTTTTTTTSTSRSAAFMQWYEGYLEAAPVRTKMVTGSILWSLGDAVAQVVPQVAAGSSSSENSPTTTTLQLSDIQYDWARTGRACFFGFAIHAPTSHVHYNLLEWMTVRANVTGLYIPVFKAIMEQVSQSVSHSVALLVLGSTQYWWPRRRWEGGGFCNMCPVINDICFLSRWNGCKSEKCWMAVPFLSLLLLY